MTLSLLEFEHAKILEIFNTHIASGDDARKTLATDCKNAYITRAAPLLITLYAGANIVKAGAVDIASNVDTHLTDTIYLVMRNAANDFTAKLYTMSLIGDHSTHEDRGEYISQIEIGKHVASPKLSSAATCTCGLCDADIVMCEELVYTNVDMGNTKRAKSGDPNRHQKFWAEHIQGKERTALPADILQQLRSIMERQKKCRYELNVSLMRHLLKQIPGAKLNDRTSALIAALGGRPAPQLSKQEDDIAASRFNHAMRLHAQIDRDKGNRPYFPYFMYQIYAEMFKNEPEKRRIVQYIHLQSRDTVIKNDLNYKKICELAGAEKAHLHGLVYRPTDLESIMMNL